MDTQNRDGQHNFLLYKYLRSIQTSLLFSVFLFNVSACLLAAEKYTFEAESAKFIGEANKASDGDASGGYLVDLIKPDDGIRFTDLPAAEKLAIRYTSVDVGTISITVNDQPERKVNVHSSGASTSSFLFAIIDVVIHAKSVLTISLTCSDVPVNIDRIIVGDGDLELPPDIWNLPPLSVADGPYKAYWKEISHRCSVRIM